MHKRWADGNLYGGDEMRTVGDPCRHICAEAVDDGFHEAVFALQLHDAELSVVHGKHLAAEGGNIIPIRWFGL